MTFDDAYELRKPLGGPPGGAPGAPGGPKGDRIFFAGEHTAFPEDAYGTVHGAFVSGQRAAREIISKHVGRNFPTGGSEFSLCCEFSCLKFLSFLAFLLILC